MSDLESESPDKSPSPEDLHRLRQALQAIEPDEESQVPPGAAEIVSKELGVLRLTHSDPDRKFKLDSGVTKALLNALHRSIWSSRVHYRYKSSIDELFVDARQYLQKANPERELKARSAPAEAELLEILRTSRRQRNSAEWCAVLGRENGNPLVELLVDGAEAVEVAVLVPGFGRRRESIRRLTGTLRRRSTTTLPEPMETKPSVSQPRRLFALGAESATELDDDDGFPLEPIGATYDDTFDDEIELELVVDDWPEDLRPLHAELAEWHRPLTSPLSKTFRWAELEERIVRPAESHPADEGNVRAAAKTVAARSSVRTTSPQDIPTAIGPRSSVDQTKADAPVSADESRVPDDDFGRYRLVDKIGEGGFGAVWLAEQLEPVRRQVALKVMKPGMDSQVIAIRFEAERRALAMLDHPNIAKAIDAGTTNKGHPFYVMELVKGVPIKEYSEQHPLRHEELLKLLVSVCDAMCHAHGKGVLHRDIKPSNVLVTMSDGEPVPMVVDFGLGGTLGQPLSEQSLLTQQGVDPDQVVATRSDRLEWACIDGQVMVVLDGSDSQELDGRDSTLLIAELQYTTPDGPESHVRPIRLKRVTTAERTVFGGRVKLRVPSAVTTDEVTLVVRNVEPADLPLVPPELRKEFIRVEQSAVLTSRRQPAHVLLSTTHEELGDLLRDRDAALGLCVVQEGGTSHG